MKCMTAKLTGLIFNLELEKNHHNKGAECTLIMRCSAPIENAFLFTVFLL